MYKTEVFVQNNILNQKQSCYQHSCTRNIFWAVSEQLLLTTLDQNLALLIGSWQNTELGVCKKPLMYKILLSFKKLYPSFSSWVLQHVKFGMFINTKLFRYLYKILGKIIKILVLLAFLHLIDLIFCLYLTSSGH